MYKEKEDIVLKVSEIQSKLKISKTKAYDLCNQNLFPVLRIGNSIRVPIDGFENWYKQNSRGCDVHGLY